MLLLREDTFHTKVEGNETDSGMCVLASRQGQDWMAVMRRGKSTQRAIPAGKNKEQEHSTAHIRIVNCVCRTGTIKGRRENESMERKIQGTEKKNEIQDERAINYKAKGASFLELKPVRLLRHHCRMDPRWTPTSAVPSYPSAPLALVAWHP